MRTETILLVDDDMNTLKALYRELTSKFWAVLLAENVEVATELMNRHKIAVAIVDEKMPGCSGLEFLGYVQNNHPETRCILLTGWAPHFKIKTALKDGRIRSFLRKPWNSEDLLKQIEDAMDATIADGTH